MLRGLISPSLASPVDRQKWSNACQQHQTSDRTGSRESGNKVNSEVGLWIAQKPSMCV